jgi:DNA-directed RNA polymerase I subunit RPA1
VLSTSGDKGAPGLGHVSEYRRKVIGEFLKRQGASTMCPHCKAHIPNLHRHANTKIFQTPLRKGLQAGGGGGSQASLDAAGREESDASGEEEEEELPEDADVSRGMKYMTPLHVYEHLRALWRNEFALLDLVFAHGSPRRHGKAGRKPAPGGSGGGPDHRLFFTEVLAVPPCRFRPPSVFGDSSFDHPQNGYLVEILRLSQRILDLRLHAKQQQQPGGSGKGKGDGGGMGEASGDEFGQLVQAWVALQQQVNYFYDSSSNTSVSGGKIPPAGIKQILEKKEGLFRKHMMGKRVNYAARSVISPDVNLETCEIGVPMVFARRLTYPEPVTPYNVRKLRQAVINGPERHPGASHVQMEDGTLASLEHLGPEGRMALANQLLAPATNAGSAGGKKVLRHIENGDVVLMNRQPTLHKPSIMAHRARILPGEKTIRMHYANCNTFNADFDGDEMNMHFPQSELGRAEAYEIAANDRQYLVPTDGSPLRGLIQDHIVTGVLLTLKETFLTREVVQQLLYGALPETLSPILMVPPTIVRPVALWSGKAVITALLRNLTAGRPALTMTGAKGKIGARLWRGHEEEAQVNVLEGALCTGVMDKAQIGDSPYGLVHAVHEVYGPATAGLLLTALSRLLTRYDQYIGFTCRMDDILLTPAANAARRRLIDDARAKGRHVLADFLGADPEDRDALRAGLERAVRSEEQSRALDGAFKGKMNALTSQIIEACLPEGQLKPFPYNNMSLMTTSGAKGSMVNFSQISGCLGQQELEGRRVPVMVSGKTLPSFAAWDARPRAGGYITQRFLTGIRPQEFFFHCMAGREGLIDTAVKTSRSGYLQRCLIKHLEGLQVHYDHTIRDADGALVQFYYGEDGLDVTRHSYLLDRFDFCAANFEAMVATCKPAASLAHLETGEAVLERARKAWRKPGRYEPVMARYSPSVHLGATSDRFYAALEAYIAANPSGTIDRPAPGGCSAKQFRALMWLKYQRALADPGEAVGLLAAQSIGEPSTQMTLNTFHFAGFGAKNVTLGIPRLREIIMTASQRIKTPSMTLPLRREAAEDPAKLAARLSKLSLRELVGDVQVSERLVLTGSVASAVNAGRRSRVYGVEIRLRAPLPRLQEQYGLAAAEIQSAIEGPFAQRLVGVLERTIKRAKGGGSSPSVEIVASAALTGRRAPSTGKAADDGCDAKEAAKHQEEDSESEPDAGPTGLAGDDEAMAPLPSADGEAEESSSPSSEEEDAAAMEEEGGDEDGPSPADAAELKSGSYMAQTRNIRNYRFTQAAIAFDLVFPAATPKLLMLDILERVIPDVTVRQLPAITRFHAVPASNTAPAALSSEGVNIHAIWEYAHLFDLARLASNDIHAILTAYGVEAARATIVREIAAVFEVYGISVDPRHLYLIADYMTADGQYRPFNRSGIDASPSPIHKMTFETTVNFLRQAALFRDSDPLRNPSARIVLGLPVGVGTGSFQLCHPIVKS